MSEIVRNEWVSFRRYGELKLCLPGPSLHPPLQSVDADVAPNGSGYGSYGGIGPVIRYRIERRVPRRRPSRWDGFEFNLEDIEDWMAWAAAELVRSPDGSEKPRREVATFKLAAS